MKSEYVFLRNFEDLETFWVETTNISPSMLQLSSGELNFQVHADDFDGVHLTWVQSEGRQLWRDILQDTGGIHFGYVIESAGPVRCSGQEIGEADALLWSPGQEIDYLLHGPLTSLEFSVSKEFADTLGWQPNGRSLNAVSKTDLDNLTHVSSMASSWLRASAGQQEPISQARTGLWRDRILEALGSVLKPWTDTDEAVNRQANGARHYEIVRAAERNASLFDISTGADMETLAADLGISRRQLFYSFQKTLGTGPRRFFELKRLHALRKELLNAHRDTATVTGLAYGHGFTQLGRMAGLYKKQFGESPSATLGRSI